MERNTSILVILLFAILIEATSQQKPPLILKFPGAPGDGGLVAPLTLKTCPAPNEQMLKCMREWACQYIIRLDLRCLLNLNGNPLLGGLLGGNGAGGAGGGGGLLGNLLGR